MFRVAGTLLDRVRRGGVAVCCTLPVAAEMGFSRASACLPLEKNNVSQGIRVTTLFLVASYTIFRIMIKVCYWEAIFLLSMKYGTGRHPLVPFALVVNGYWKRYQVLMPLCFLSSLARTCQYALSFDLESLESTHTHWEHAIFNFRTSLRIMVQIFAWVT